MPEAYAAKQALLVDLCNPLLLQVSSNGIERPFLLSKDFQFVPLPDAPGFELARVLAPAGFSATLLRGTDGAHSPRFAAPQTVRVEVLAGKLLWWQAGWGPQETNDSYRLVKRGDVLLLDPDEEHTYRALSQCLTYNLFSPAIEDVLT